MTLYHVNVNSVHTCLLRLMFVAAIDYENIFTTKFHMHVETTKFLPLY